MTRLLNENPAYAPILRGKAPTTRRGKICKFLRDRKHGATVDEICIHFGLLNQQVSPRVSELRKKNIIHSNGERRVTRSGGKARVYKWGSDPNHAESD